MDLITSAKDPDMSTWVYTYELLRRNILYFRLRPGEPISENKLAAELNISRSPVRDAISKLAGEGLIKVFPQRGSVISYLSRRRIQEFLFMRTALEDEVLKQACRVMTEEQIDALEESLQKQRQWLDEKRLYDVLEEDYHMHYLIYEACGKGFVWDSYRFLNSDQIRIRYLKLSMFYYREPIFPATIWDLTLTEHQQLIEAIRNHDDYTACRVSDRHINQIAWDTDQLENLFPHYFIREEN